MTLLDWIPAITSSTALTTIGFVAGTFFKSKVEAALKRSIDEKITRLQSQLRKDEEHLKAQLSSYEKKLSSLSSGALSALSLRHEILNRKRIEATERLWGEVVKQYKFKTLVTFSQRIVWKTALDVSSRGDEEAFKVRAFAADILKMSGLEKPEPFSMPDADRIHISPAVWALFAGYRHVCGRAFTLMLAVKEGIGGNLINDPKDEIELLKTVLPSHERFLSEGGDDRMFFILNALEERLYEEILKSLIDFNLDDATVKSASAIIQQVESSARTNAATLTIPASIEAKD